MRKALFLLLFNLSCLAYSQNNRLAWESNLAFNYDFQEWKFNTSVGHRTLQTESSEVINTTLAFIEINQFVTRRITPDINLSVGYKHRELEPGENIEAVEQRTTQQLAYTHLRNRLRLVSRVRAEQRFRTSRFSHRYRYRFSMDMPLSGLKLDVKELFFMASSELLLELDGGEGEIDNRISGGIGYVFSKSIKGQVDYTLRSEALNKSTDHVSFFTTSVIVSL